jgi:hypothetical protein
MRPFAWSAACNDGMIVILSSLPVVRRVLCGAEVEYTREKLLAELEQARAIAEEAHNGSAMAMATMGKAKLLGLIIDRREVGDVGSFDNMTDEVSPSIACATTQLPILTHHTTH